MKIRIIRFVTSIWIAINILLSVMPISAYATFDNNDGDYYGSDWVLWDGEWYPTGAILEDDESIQTQVGLHNTTDSSFTFA